MKSSRAGETFFSFNLRYFLRNEFSTKTISELEDEEQRFARAYAEIVRRSEPLVKSGLCLREGEDQKYSFKMVKMLREMEGMAVISWGSETAKITFRMLDAATEDGTRTGDVDSAVRSPVAVAHVRALFDVWGIGKEGFRIPK